MGWWILYVHFLWIHYYWARRSKCNKCWSDVIYSFHQIPTQCNDFFYDALKFGHRRDIVNITIVLAVAIVKRHAIVLRLGVTTASVYCICNNFRCLKITLYLAQSRKPEISFRNPVWYIPGSSYWNKNC